MHLASISGEQSKLTPGNDGSNGRIPWDFHKNKEHFVQQIYSICCHDEKGSQ